VKIVHVITTMDLGGAEKHVAALATAQADFGHNVHIVYLSGTGAAVPDWVPNSRVQAGRLADVHRIRRWIKGDGLVHAHLPRAEILGSALAAGACPLIISRHNTEPFYGQRLSALSRRGSQMIASRADTVIAISQAVRDYHLSTGHLSAGTRINVVPYGYRPPALSEAHSYVWGDRHDGAIRIASVARLTGQKDLPTLLRGVSRLRDLGHPVDLRIAGEGPDLAALMALRDSLGLTSSVSFLGKIPNPESFVAGADVFVLTSKYEGLGLVLLEAMAAGTPIVAARNTAIEEVVVDQRTGLLFETGNPDDLAAHLNELLESPQIALGLVDAGRQRLQTHFSIDRMLTQTNEIYRGAMERAN